MSPSNDQEFIPPANTPEVCYNYNALPSTSWKVNSINGNNIVPEINIYDDINSLPSASGMHHVDPRYRIYTNMPPGTTENHEKCCPDSEELPSKRDEPMHIDLEDPSRYVPPTNVNSNYPLIETNRHSSDKNYDSPPAPGLPIEEDVGEPDPLCTGEVVEFVLDAEGDQGQLEYGNFPDLNQPLQHDHDQRGILNNIDQNLPDNDNIQLPYNVRHALHQASDIEIVSEELSNMNVYDK